jgi:WD40 repeat protein
MMNIQKITTLTGHNGAIYALASSRDGRRIFSAGGDGWVVEWSLERPDLGKLVAQVETAVFSLLFFEEKNLLLAGDQNGGLRVIPIDAPENQRHILHHKKGIFDLQLIDNQLVTVGGDGCLTRWNLGNFTPESTIQLSPKSLRNFVFLEKYREIAAAASDGSIYFLDADELFLKRKIVNAHDPAVFSLVYLKEKNELVSGGRDAILRFWDLEKSPILLKKDIPAHLFTVNHAVLFGKKDAFFATASRDKTIKIWDSETSELKKVIDTLRNGGHIRSVNRLLVLPDQLLLSAGDDRQIIVWKIEP